jgi:hypothetical protein
MFCFTLYVFIFLPKSQTTTPSSQQKTKSDLPKSEIINPKSKLLLPPVGSHGDRAVFNVQIQAAC